MVGSRGSGTVRRSRCPTPYSHSRRFANGRDNMSEPYLACNCSSITWTIPVVARIDGAPTRRHSDVVQRRSPSMLSRRRRADARWKHVLMLLMQALAILIALELSGVAEAFALDCCGGEEAMAACPDCPAEQDGKQCPPDCPDCHRAHGAVALPSVLEQVGRAAPSTEPQEVVPPAAASLVAAPRIFGVYRPPRGASIRS